MGVSWEVGVGSIDLLASNLNVFFVRYKESSPDHTIATSLATSKEPISEEYHVHQFIPLYICDNLSEILILVIAAIYIYIYIYIYI